jgi:hypothetical protein
MQRRIKHKFCVTKMTRPAARPEVGLALRYSGRAKAATGMTSEICYFVDLKFADVARPLVALPSPASVTIIRNS